MFEFPKHFLDNIRSAPGFNETAFIKSHDDSPPVSIRLNLNKPIDGYESAMPVPWCAQGRYLDERPAFTLDPLLHAGCYYVQEASSMFCGYALQQSLDLRQPVKVLDLCAAPGGKSTDIISRISTESLMVSNEPVKQRVQVLMENMQKWSCSNAVVTHCAAGRFRALPQYFDAITVDAPCTGSGLFRKNESAIQHWNMQNLQMCVQRQQTILEDVLPALKTGGVLMYSTCSYSVEENEDITDFLITKYGFEPVFIPRQPAWNIVEVQTSAGGFGYRFYPDKVKGEGFYISVLRNTKAIAGDYAIASKSSRIQAASIAEKNMAASLLKEISQFEIIKVNQVLIALPNHLSGEVQLLASRLPVLQSGIALGEIKGSDLLPAHALALSGIQSDAIPQFELDLQDALQYLRRQAIHIPGDYTGWALVCYKRIPLGWIKKLAGRINNYYPTAYRIRM